MRKQESGLSRREFLVHTGVVSSVILTSSALMSLVHPGLTEAAAKAPEPQNVNDVLKEFFGNRKVEMAHVTMKAPIIAENGAVVPIDVSSDLPVEPDNYVKKVYFFVDENFRPYTASATLSPENGKADLALRIKMRKTSNVRVILESNKGKLYGDIKKVKVTIGGCGG